MRRCGFLTMDSLEDFQCYDHLLYEPLAKAGWEVSDLSWRNREVNWNEFEVVIVRSPWDYQDDPETFLEVLGTIESSTARLENPLSLVKWNISKYYLKDLAQKGIPVVPSLFGNSPSEDALRSSFTQLNYNEIVIKPLISANADDTFRLTRNDHNLAHIQNLFQGRDYLLQPFMEAIVTEGEYSLFFFGGTYSHAILKTPQTGDFRVQEEHGGRLQLIEPETLLLDDAQKAMNALSPTPLYGRVDFVRDNGNFYLMEMELIEPSLYFNMDSESPARFVQAFNRWMDRNPASTKN